MLLKSILDFFVNVYMKQVFKYMITCDIYSHLNRYFCNNNKREKKMFVSFVELRILLKIQ